MSVNILGLCRVIFYHTSATGDAQSPALAVNIVYNGQKSNFLKGNLFSLTNKGPKITINFLLVLL